MRRTHANSPSLLAPAYSILPMSASASSFVRRAAASGFGALGSSRATAAVGVSRLGACAPSRSMFLKKADFETDVKNFSLVRAPDCAAWARRAVVAAARARVKMSAGAACGGSAVSLFSQSRVTPTSPRICPAPPPNI